MKEFCFNDIVKSILCENDELEARGIGNMDNDYAEKITAKVRELDKLAYGDTYGKENDELKRKHGIKKKSFSDDTNIATGLFSVGNAKLSDDTLIINFTTAFMCPSRFDCPIGQTACYATHGEKRLEDTFIKNLRVERFWNNAIKNGKLGDCMQILKWYIEGFANTTKPIKYIRYNEAGDFTNQEILNLAAEFSYNISQEPYNIISMAYSANKKIDFTVEDARWGNQPIDHVIKINASREDLKLSKDTPSKEFFGIPMDIDIENVDGDFSKLLQNNSKSIHITDADLTKLNFIPPKENANGLKSIPSLQYGTWSGNDGGAWYYICPCSFWKIKKDREEIDHFNDFLQGKIEEDYEPIGYDIDGEMKRRFRSHYFPKEKGRGEKTGIFKRRQDLDARLNAVKSPCGVDCAVCHNMDGGIAVTDGPNTKIGDNVYKYYVLTATHCGGAIYYEPEYAERKRHGDDSVVSKLNPNNPKKLWKRSEDLGAVAKSKDVILSPRTRKEFKKKYANDEEYKKEHGEYEWQTRYREYTIKQKENREKRLKFYNMYDLASDKEKEKYEKLLKQQEIQNLKENFFSYFNRMKI